MNNITYYITILVAVCCLNITHAQEEHFKKDIEILEQRKISIMEEERQALKREVEAINEHQQAGNITPQEAQKQKEEAAKKHVLNIENRVAIADHTIALLRRGVAADIAHIGNGHNQLNIQYKKGQYGVPEDIFTDTHRRYDRRTYSDFVIALGLNHTIIKGQSLNDSPYAIGKSRFFEIGWAWMTRVFEHTNFLRVKYGVSLQFNGLSPKDNMYFLRNDNQTVLTDFPERLNKAKLRIDNLVIPVHVEFGPSKKMEKETSFRYNTDKKFKIGIGGYAGLNMGVRQKLKYRQDGDRIKEKIKNNYNTNNFIYGLSAYIGIDDISLYAKYNLNPLFNTTAPEENTVSIGLRFDL